MRQREEGDTETIRAAHQFIARDAKLAWILQTGAYEKVTEALNSIDRRAVAQVSEGMAGQSATQSAEVAKDELIRGHMQRIASVADMLAAEYPPLKSLRMPGSCPATTLATHAAGMAVEARKYREQFIEEGLPANFIEQMELAIQRFKDASGEPQQHRSNRHGATAGAEADLKQAKKYLKVLDSFVQKTANEDPSMMAAWNSVKRFPARKKVANEVQEPPAVAPPPMLPAPAERAEPIQLTARVEETEPAKRSALWALKNLFRI